MAALATMGRQMSPKQLVPARGGLGDNVNYRLTLIATVLAQRLGASYRQLYVPDSVSEQDTE